MKKIILVMLVIIPIILLAQDWNVEVNVRGYVGLNTDLQALNTEIKTAINNTLDDADYKYRINIVQDSIDYYDIYLEINGTVDSVDALAPATNTFFNSKFDKSWINFEAFKKYYNGD